MKWAALNVDRESDPGWFEIPADLRGHHRALIVACSRFENGGIIEGCRPWSGKRWWAFAGVKRQTIERLVALKLALWLEDGASLQVAHYDLYAESHVKNLRAAGRKGAKVRWEAHARAIAEAASGVDGPPSGGAAGEAAGQPPAVAMRPSPSPSPPDPDAAPISAPNPSGWPPSSSSWGGSGGEEGRRRAPRGAEDPEAGPEGFETWWALFPKTRARWREDALSRWVAQDLEGETDEILAFTRHQMDSPTWKKGEYYVDSPRDFLRTAGWRKRGRWNAPPAAAPPRPRSSETRPEVLHAGLVDVTGAHGWLLELLGDAEVDEQTKERHRRQWMSSHPGQTPPWEQNGRAS